MPKGSNFIFRIKIYIAINHGNCNHHYFYSGLIFSLETSIKTLTAFVMSLVVINLRLFYWPRTQGVIPFNFSNCSLELFNFAAPSVLGMDFLSRFFNCGQLLLVQIPMLGSTSRRSYGIEVFQIYMFVLVAMVDHKTTPNRLSCISVHLKFSCWFRVCTICNIFEGCDYWTMNNKLLVAERKIHM